MKVDTLSVGQTISDGAKRISQLARVDSVLSSDLFFVSRHRQKYVQAVILKELEENLSSLIVCLEDGYVAPQSCHYLINETKRAIDGIRYHYTDSVSYASLARQALSGVSCEFDFGSMAYEEYWDYSRRGHTHDFTRARLSAAYSSPSCVLSCGILDSKGLEYTAAFCLPDAGIPDSDVYSIGEIKFLALNGRTVDIDSKAFDGWVFADGKSYSKSDFPNAYEVFKSAPGATPTTFAVPVISGFVRPYPAADKNLVRTAFANHVSAHTHSDIDGSQFESYSQSIDVTLKLPVYFSGGGTTQSTAVHTGYSKYYGTLTNLSVEISDQKFVTSKTKTNKMAEQESKPRRNVFSAMVYIGEKAK